jgi:uncharacterized paraquat-inducible protein A
MSMKSCPSCRSLVHELAPVCPNCDLRLRPRSKLWWVLALAPIAGAIVWYLSS